METIIINKYNADQPFIINHESGKMVEINLTIKDDDNSISINIIPWFSKQENGIKFTPIPASYLEVYDKCVVQLPNDEHPVHSGYFITYYTIHACPCKGLVGPKKIEAIVSYNPE